MPHLTIMIPAYNAEKTLKKCLGRIKTSTYTDYEILLIDDGSADATCDIAREYTDSIVKHDSNGNGYFLGLIVAITGRSGE